MKVLITGGSGFVGGHLIEFFAKKDTSITILTRDKNKLENKELTLVENLDEISDDCHFDAIINLAGAAIDKRWSKNYKQKLVDSRISTTKAVYNLVKRLSKKPRTIISASAVGYYGSNDGTIIDENTKANNEFTHQLCNKWESEAMAMEEFGCRVSIIRLGVVLGKNGGMLKKVLTPFKMALGGKIGSGGQYLSWVHIDDVVSAISFLLETKDSQKIYNLSAPNPVTNLEWTKTLGSALKQPTILPMPKLIVKLLFGEMGQKLLLSGQRVIPTNLTQAGFRFKYTHLTHALDNILYNNNGN